MSEIRDNNSPSPEGKSSPVKRYLDKKQVAELLLVTEKTIETWMKEGFLPYFRIGRTIRFNEHEILEFLKDNAKQN